MMIKYFTAFLLLFFLDFAVAVEYQVSPLASSWQNKTSKTACDLIQTIPQYGQAFFSIRPEEPLQFGIYQTSDTGMTVSQANLTALPAPWRHEFHALKNYPVYIDQRVRSKYLSVFGIDAEMAVDILLATDFPTFTYINRRSEELIDDVRVTVSPIHFLPAYQKFEACRTQLMPYAMKSLQDQIIYFFERSKQINSSALGELAKISEYMRAMPDTKLVIASDTSSVGKSDAKLFMPRAKKIHDFFLKNKIEKSRVSIRSVFLTKNLANPEKVFRVHVFGPDVLKMFWFHKGSVHLIPKEKARLKLVAQYMQYQTQPLIINSHTDGMGRRAKNQLVSQKRGDVIKSYLQSQGVPAEKLKVRAFGERKPVASNRTRRGQAKNRRVELVFSR